MYHLNLTFLGQIEKNIGQINLTFKIFYLDFRFFHLSNVKIVQGKNFEKFGDDQQSWENDLTNQKPGFEHNDWFQDGVNGLFVRSDLHGYFYFYGLVHWFTDFEN